MSIISVNNNKVLGRIKPVHSVVGFPSTSVRSEIRWNRGYLDHIPELGMPYARFNGVGGTYGSMTYVDVSNIFRNFDADEFDEASYDFTFTDWLVWECVLHGVKPVYRLGVGKEPDHWLKAYKIFPPKDYAKFARICEHIILHYNVGWNGGYKAGIKYWEIWDGPDNARKIEDNACWKGTKEQYFEFYGVVSNYLKNKFPALKFGGYSANGFNLEDNSDYSTEFFGDFLKYVTAEETKAPLDFFTWNSATNNPQTNQKVANFVREKLDVAGLNECESICGAWCSGVENPGEVKSGAFVGANLVAWQNSPVSKAMYDSCSMGSPFGLFGLTIRSSTVPSYGYYAMQSFNKLYKLGFQVQTDSDDQNVFAVAGADFAKTSVMIVNLSDEKKEVELKTIDVNRNKATVTIIKEVETEGLTYDELRNVILPRKVSAGPLKFTMQPNEVRLYEFE